MLFADILMRRDIATVPLGIGRIHRIEKLEDEIPGKEDRLREIVNHSHQTVKVPTAMEGACERCKS